MGPQCLDRCGIASGNYTTHTFITLLVLLSSFVNKATAAAVYKWSIYGDRMREVTTRSHAGYEVVTHTYDREQSDRSCIGKKDHFIHNLFNWTNHWQIGWDFTTSILAVNQRSIRITAGVRSSLNFPDEVVLFDDFVNVGSDIDWFHVTWPEKTVDDLTPSIGVTIFFFTVAEWDLVSANLWIRFIHSLQNSDSV